MDNRINEIRQQIRALRFSMLKAEAVMREQIERDEECSSIAYEILSKRTVLAALVRQKSALGDNEPIEVKGFSLPRRAFKPSRSPLAGRPAKRRLKPRIH